MKKKILGILLCLVAVLGISTATALAEVTTGDGYTYNTDNGKLQITTTAGLTNWTSGGVNAADVKKLVIGSEVTTLPAGTFSSCTNLRSIVFEGNITLAPNDSEPTANPFEGMQNLTSVVFKGKADLTNAFVSCSDLTAVSFKSTSTIAGTSFKDCTEIATLEFMDDTTLNGSAFNLSEESTNDALTSLIFQGNATFNKGYIGFPGKRYTALKSVIFQGDADLYGGLSSLPNLQEVTFEGNAILNGQFKFCPNLKTITFKGESSLNSAAFQDCANIESLTFGKATSINSVALMSCNGNLTSLVFPAGSEFNLFPFGSFEKLESITFEGDVTLAGSVSWSSKSLKSITFEGDSIISDYTFRGCEALETVTFKGGSTISGEAFSNCEKLKNISFGKKVTLEGNAFAAIGTHTNALLEKLVFPAGSTISSEAFNNYTNLKSVTFDGGVSLGANSFTGCTSLKDFYFNSEVTSGVNFESCTFSAFDYTGDNAISIYVPNSTAVKAYKAKLRSDKTGEKNNALYEVCVKSLAHDWNEDTGVCDDCGTYNPTKVTTADPVWEYDSTQHWQICDECKGRMNVANHVYDNSSDTTCNVCEYERTIRHSSGSGSGSSGGSSSGGSSGSGSSSSSGSGSTGTSTGGNTGTDTGTDTGAGTGTGTDTGAGTGTGTGTGTETPAQTPTITTPENGTVTPSTDGTTATITPDAGYEVETVKVNGEDKGTVYELTGLKTGDKVDVTFTKSTFSGSVSKLTPLVVRTSKTAKKNIKATIKLSDSNKVAIAALENLGYTVKYKFYRSTKKTSGYKAKMTKDTTTYVNTKGVKKKMYYYKARIMVYDANGTLVAKTALKDCKYGNRRWSKK